jgi:hypothetical protein
MLASVTLALGLAALLASALPAWRAAGVEPMVALRNVRDVPPALLLCTVVLSARWSAMSFSAREVPISSPQVSK